MFQAVHPTPGPYGRNKDMSHFISILSSASPGFAWCWCCTFPAPCTRLTPPPYRRAAGRTAISPTIAVDPRLRSCETCPPPAMRSKSSQTATSIWLNSLLCSHNNPPAASQAGNAGAINHRRDGDEHAQRCALASVSLATAALTHSSATPMLVTTRVRTWSRLKTATFCCCLT